MVHGCETGSVELRAKREVFPCLFSPNSIPLQPMPCCDIATCTCRRDFHLTFNGSRSVALSCLSSILFVSLCMFPSVALYRPLLLVNQWTDFVSYKVFGTVALHTDMQINHQETMGT